MNDLQDLEKNSFGKLVEEETIRRNLRKSPSERVATLMAALDYSWKHGMWPRIDRKAKEEKLLCLIRQKSSPHWWFCRHTAWLS